MEFTIEGCPGRASIQTNLWLLFFCRRVWDTIVVLEEDNQPHRCYPRSDMFVPWRDLNRRHPATDMCSRGVDMKFWCLVEDEAHVGVAMALQAYGRPLASVSSLK